jgi:N-acetylmuramoyl-L-alanine amidase
MKLNSKIKYIIWIFFLLNISLSAQRLLKISVSLGDKSDHLSYVSRKGLSFVSARELADLLGGSYYFNQEAHKVEMKFSDYNLKVTARNQFIVIKSKNSSTQSVFQIPISTLFIKNDVFLPLKYCINYIGFANGRELIFNEKEKHLTLSGERMDWFAAIQKNPELSTIAPSKRTSNSAFDIYSLQIDEKTNGTLIRLGAGRPIHKYSSSIINKKLRLYFSGVTIDPDLLENFKPAGFVRNAEVITIQDTKQIEFALKEGYSIHESSNDIESDDIIITIHNKVFSDYGKNLEAEKREWTFNTIVLDPGHGGRDPGAIGITGVREKDINLAVSKKVGNLIKANMTDVSVVYTRETDKFVELYKRGKIANENDGELFISIHCNSLGKNQSSTRGFEVYLLRPGKTQKAIEIAEFENSVIKLEENPERYEKLTDENFILVSMAHSAYMRYSEEFSKRMSDNWSKYATGIPSRGVKQAGFYVLVGASMPGVLIESGFISNKKDEKYLKSERGQNEVAQAVYQSIKEYRAFYENQLEQESP